MSFRQQLRNMARNWEEVTEAVAIYTHACGGKMPPKVAGYSVEFRMSVRTDVGFTPEQAAAREYLYRWNLALRSRVFGVPHALGL